MDEDLSGQLLFPTVPVRIGDKIMECVGNSPPFTTKELKEAVLSTKNKETPKSSVMLYDRTAFCWVVLAR